MDEYETLSDQIDEITTGYSAEDASISGVLAVWSGREITFHDGMVRPEDVAEDGQADGSDAGAGGDLPEGAIQDK